MKSLRDENIFQFEIISLKLDNKYKCYTKLKDIYAYNKNICIYNNEGLYRDEKTQIEIYIHIIHALKNKLFLLIASNYGELACMRIRNDNMIMLM